VIETSKCYRVTMGGPEATYQGGEGGGNISAAARSQDGRTAAAVEAKLDLPVISPAFRT